jgi:hypothetical protein
MGEKLTATELNILVADAKKMLPPYSLWTHRKGGTYRVNDIALTSDDLTVVVIYRNINNDAPAFTRPVSEFLDGRFVCVTDDIFRTVRKSK